MTQKSMHQPPSPGLITQDVNETEERELMTAVSSVRQTKQVIGWQIARKAYKFYEDRPQLLLLRECLKEVTVDQQDAQKGVQFNSYFNFIKSYPMQIYIEGRF